MMIKQHQQNPNDFLDMFADNSFRGDSMFAEPNFKDTSLFLQKQTSNIDNYLFPQNFSDNRDFIEYEEPLEPEMQKIYCSPQEQYNFHDQETKKFQAKKSEEVIPFQLFQDKDVTVAKDTANSEISVKIEDENLQSKIVKKRQTRSRKTSKIRKNYDQASTTTEASEYQETSEESIEEYNPKKSKKLSKGIRKSKKQKEDTKNLLRNFGGAQSKFVKDHEYSHQLINQKYADLNPSEKKQKFRQFREWMPAKLENFKQFQEVWSRTGEFADLYREICWAFYEKFAMNYVFTSRLTDENTRMTHEKYIFRFLEGILDPSTFFYFKKL